MPQHALRRHNERSLSQSSLAGQTLNDKNGARDPTATRRATGIDARKKWLKKSHPRSGEPFVFRQMAYKTSGAPLRIRSERIPGNYVARAPSGDGEASGTGRDRLGPRAATSNVQIAPPLVASRMVWAQR
jgi:hypothetical protein